MTDYKISVDIAAPPELVWDVMSDVERWSEWTASISSIQRLDAGGPLRVGSRALVRQPRIRPAVWQVTELHEGRSFSWITRAAGVVAMGRHSVEAVANGTRATLALKFSGFFAPLVGWLFGRLNQRYLALEASGLKARSQAFAAAPHIPEFNAAD
ncbi:MAG TPA: SRPBCC family protein [Terriglobales bacterium]|nr:SRPBCC family protein [Terriglobales bacterium]